MVNYIIFEISNKMNITLNISEETNEVYFEIAKEELIKQAETYAIRRAGRSPGVTKQFVELFKQ